jgi:hypothetical protein
MRHLLALSATLALAVSGCTASAIGGVTPGGTASVPPQGGQPGTAPTAAPGTQQGNHPGGAPRARSSAESIVLTLDGKPVDITNRLEVIPVPTGIIWNIDYPDVNARPAVGEHYFTVEFKTTKPLTAADFKVADITDKKLLVYVGEDVAGQDINRQAAWNSTHSRSIVEHYDVSIANGKVDVSFAGTLQRTAGESIPMSVKVEATIKGLPIQ